VTIGVVTASILALLLSFTLAPGAFLRLALLLCPKEDVKRVEYLADFYCIPRRDRPRWVLGQMLRCVSEGPSARAYARKTHKSASERLRLVSVVTDVVEVSDGDTGIFVETANELDLVRTAMHDLDNGDFGRLGEGRPQPDEMD
jgi:hypothetical protein